MLAVNIACSAIETSNTNTNVNAVTNLNNANLPPEFSGSPLPMSANSTPGIPNSNSVNINSMPKGATSTPGIPDEKNIGKPLPRGATPTPGIPDEKTLKEQINNSASNSRREQKPPQSDSNPTKSPTNRPQ
ncbi:MAG: hypothetical protein H0W58_12005 [Acidobacteria bacterium]|jgi:hypothetical protein|nr:hypothetical protein [Acidobacteriota bacterium]